MKFKMTGSPSIPLDRLKADLDRRVENFGRALAQDAARVGATKVASKISGPQSWISLYQRAVDYRGTADGKKFAVIAETDRSLTTNPAARTLVSFDGDGIGIDILAEYGKLVVDLIPPFVYPGITARFEEPVPEDAVMNRRSEVAKIVTELEAKLAAAGLSKSGDFPVFDNGKVYDIRFLAQAMELGLPGHKQQKHWMPGIWAVFNALKSPSSSARIAADGALAGANVPTDRIMSELEAKLYEIMMREDWA